MLLCLVASGGFGVESRLRTELAEPAVARGWRLAVTLTPTAAHWLHRAGGLERVGAPARPAVGGGGNRPAGAVGRQTAGAAVALRRGRRVPVRAGDGQLDRETGAGYRGQP